jgi:hypothetical protein
VGEEDAQERDLPVLDPEYISVRGFNLHATRFPLPTVSGYSKHGVAYVKGLFDLEVVAALEAAKPLPKPFANRFASLECAPSKVASPDENISTSSA